MTEHTSAPGQPDLRARAFFHRPEFQAQPARAGHGLVRRLPAGADTAAIQENLDAAKGRHALLDSLQLWIEQLAVDSDSPAAENRRARELGRAVTGTGTVVRAVVLGYAGGDADLVLVAHRGTVDRRTLDRLADVLLDPAAGGELPEPAGFPAGPNSAAPRLDWGLGDPAETGRYGRVPLTAPAPAGALVPTLVAATGLALSRYGAGDQPRLTLLAADLDAADALVQPSLPIPDDATLADLVAAAAPAVKQADADPLDAAFPPLGLLVTTGRSGDRYEPALAPPFPLTVHWEQIDSGALAGSLQYDLGTVHSEVAESFARHLMRIVGALAADAPQVRAADLELVDAEEGARILAAGRPKAPAVTPETIHGAFRRIAGDQPDAAALSFEELTLTYRELDEQSDAVAAGLLAAGVAAGDKVGVCLDRDARLVVTLLGVLKSGAAYVPMDPGYPAERLAYTVQDAGITVVVTASESFPAVEGVRLLDPADLPAGGQPADEDPASPDAPAYVIYTSGSTGRPKGVVVPHRNVGALMAATAKDFRLGATDVWTFFHSSAFDFSIWEIWGCLLTGGHLIVVPYFTSRTPEEFYQLLVDRRVTVLSQTPSAFAALQDSDQQRKDELALRLVVFGGEPLDVKALEGWFRRHKHTRCRLVNMFGITETTVHVTAQTITPVEVAAGSRSVGRAIPGWSVSVRDRAGRLQPYGVPGEIYVAGAGVADHYLGRPELTAERFVNDELTGERTYRSGDLGRLRPDGRLDHLGRIDDQVKVRGFRIELGEIRSVLLDDPGVAAAVVIREEGEPGDASSVRLAAYLVLQGAGTVEDVRRRATRYLPEYMVPSAFFALPALPLTVNGKVDLAKLAPLAAEQAAADQPSGTTAADAAGEGVAGIVLQAWRDLLGPELAPDDDWFESGGNSLMAVKLAGALRRAGLPPVTLRELYRNPTAAELAELITERQLAAAGD